MENNGLQMKYFVLSPFSKDEYHALASKIAIRAYAEVIGQVDADRKKDILEWIGDEEFFEVFTW